jgi:hypothetical protein
MCKTLQWHSRVCLSWILTEHEINHFPADKKAKEVRRREWSESAFGRSDKCLPLALTHCLPRPQTDVGGGCETCDYSAKSLNKNREQ